MPVYETHDALQAFDDHTAAIVALSALALIGNYTFWITNLRRGWRAQRYTMPVPCVCFFLCHDATYLANYDRWFNEIDHVFPKLFWVGLVLSFSMEVAFLVMLLRFGRKELAPDATQSQFTAAVGAGIVFTLIPWLVIKDVMDDELFLIIFGITIFWCAPWYLALMWRRQDPVGQSVTGWLGFLMMPLFYWPATMILADGFQSFLWISLGALTVLGGLINIAVIRYLQGRGDELGLLEAEQVTGAGNLLGGRAG